MYYFSNDFFDGLKTKSENFQNKFFGIIDDICTYFDEEDEKIDFQQYIESNHSYKNPGNILYSSKKYFGGSPSLQELKEKIHHYLLWLFDSFESADAMAEVPHIIVCISAPENALDDEDMSFIEKLLSFERICRGCLPVGVTTILNNNTEKRTTSCYVACLK